MSHILREIEGIFRTGDLEAFHCHGLTHNENIAFSLPADVKIRHSENNILFGQALGEGIELFTEMLPHIHMGEKDWGDICWDDDKYKFFLEVKVDKAWREAGAIQKNVGFYRAVLYGECIQIGAYDLTGKYLPSRMDFPKQYSKYIPVVAILIAFNMIVNKDFNELVKSYSVDHKRDDFFRIYFGLIDRYCFKSFDVRYDTISYLAFKNANSYAAQYLTGPVIIEESKSKKKQEISQFEKKEFSEEQLGYIPHLGDEFVFPEQLYSLANALAEGDIRSILFHGPAGTGKTMACKLLAEKTGLPLMDTINCTENLDEYVLGKYIPEGEQIVFKESYVTKAIREGGAVVFEEINFAKPQYLSFLNSLLDDNGFVRLDNGEVIRRHPNFRFMATMNVGYFGTRELNQALYNRFQAIVEIKDLSDDAIKTMLIERVPDCAGFIDNAMDLYHQIKDKIKREELDVVLSPRNLENWMRLCKYEPVEEAAEKTIIPIAKGDREMETDLRLMIKQCSRSSGR